MELYREGQVAPATRRESESQATTQRNRQEKLVEIEVLERQVVATDEGGTSEAPKSTRFVGRRNQTVDEDTRASRTGEFSSGDGSTGTSLPPLAELSMKELGIGGDISSDAPEKRPRDFGIAATDDQLDDVRLGQRTLLSTQETKFYAFFERAKRQVRSRWEPELARRTATPEVKIETSRRKRWNTRVVAVLDTKGHVLSVTVSRSSGLSAIDEAARGAFLTAGIIPNPPRALFDANDQLQLPWEFNVEMRRPEIATSLSDEDVRRLRSLD